jgi:hypothetical protein
MVAIAGASMGKTVLHTAGLIVSVEASLSSRGDIFLFAGRIECAGYGLEGPEVDDVLPVDRQ